MIRHHSLRGIVAACALLSFALAAPVAAQTSVRDTTKLNFSEPVQIPAMTLPAGEYVFLVADKAAARSVVQVWNSDETELITQAIIVPTRRMDNTGEVAVRFSNTPAGTAPALRAWFVPGQNIGHAFVYPEEQAVRIARETHTVVLSSDHDPKLDDALDGAVIYRIDWDGMKLDYTDPASWADAPLMEDDETLMEGEMMTAAQQTQLIADIEAIVETALDKDGASVSLTREDLQKIQKHLDRLRDAITTPTNQINRRR